jgi:transposase-like protein
MANEPKTLQQAIVYFSNSDNCREYLIARRWPEGVTCPRCGSASVKFAPKYNRWQCGKKHDRRQFTSKTGTIFEDSPISLDNWLLAMWQIVNCKNGVSSYEIAKAIGKGFTAEEVATAKTALMQERQLSRSQDGSLVGLFVSQAELGRTMQRESDLEKKINDTTHEQLSATFKKWIDPSTISYFKAGDFKKAAAK